MPAARARLALISASACLALACASGPREPARAAAPPPVGPPSVGDLLERSDSLRLTDVQRSRLVQLNLRLFRLNRPLERRLDSARAALGPGRSAARPASMPRGPSDTSVVPWDGATATAGDSAAMLPGSNPDTTRVPAPLRGLVAQLAANHRTYLDSALAVLDAPQRETALRLLREGRRMQPGMMRGRMEERVAER